MRLAEGDFLSTVTRLPAELMVSLLPKHQHEKDRGRCRATRKLVLRMSVIQKTADWLLTVVAPKTTASACAGCQYARCYCSGGHVYHKFCCPRAPTCVFACGGCVKTSTKC